MITRETGKCFYGGVSVLSEQRFTEIRDVITASRAVGSVHDFLVTHDFFVLHHGITVDELRQAQEYATAQTVKDIEAQRRERQKGAPVIRCSECGAVMDTSVETHSGHQYRVMTCECGYKTRVQEQFFRDTIAPPKTAPIVTPELAPTTTCSFVTERRPSCGCATNKTILWCSKFDCDTMAKRKCKTCPSNDKGV